MSDGQAVPVSDGAAAPAIKKPAFKKPAFKKRVPAGGGAKGATAREGNTATRCCALGLRAVLESVLRVRCPLQSRHRDFCSDVSLSDQAVLLLRCCGSYIISLVYRSFGCCHLKKCG